MTMVMDIVSKSQFQRNGYMSIRMLNQYVYIVCQYYLHYNKNPTLLNNTKRAACIKYEYFGPIPSKRLI
jgi:hypothetical protein